MSNLLEKASILLTPTAHDDGKVLSVKPEDGTGDFDFTRNSSATRTNSQGLIEDVQILSSNLVSNGDFATDSNWNKGSNWSILNGVATSNGAGLIQQSTSDLTPGKTYKISFEITEYTSGGVKLYSGSGSDASTYKNTVGTHTDTLVLNGSTTSLYSNNFIGSVDNVSVIEITDDTNLPKIDYSPYSGAGTCGHWLFEPQSTNLITYSSDFSNASYSKANAGLGSTPIVTPDYATSPSGSQDADRIQFNLNSGTSSGDYSWMFTFPASDINGIVSIYLKTNDNTTKVVYFRNTFGTIDNITVTGNWQRYSITNTATRGFYIGLRGAQGNSDTADLSVWGAQVEEQSFATSHVPTNGSTVTRLKDTAFGSGNSSLINSTEGTLYAEIAALTQRPDSRADIALSDGTSAGNVVRIHYLNTEDNAIRVQVRSGGNITASTGQTVTDIRDFHKVAISYKVDEVKFYIDGVLIITDTNAVMPIGLNQLSFSAGNDTQNRFYGKTKCVAVFKEALTDAELTCLTTI